MKIYRREFDFVVCFCAALSLEGCPKVDFNSEALNKVMPMIKNKIEEENMFNKEARIDTLHLLFMKDVDGRYSTLIRLMNSLISFIDQTDEDCFTITCDEEDALRYLSNREYPSDKMLDLAEQVIPMIKKNEKVKTHEIYKRMARI